MNYTTARSPHHFLLTCFLGDFLVKRFFFGILALLLVVGGASQAKADFIAANMTGFGATGSVQGTVGWSFNVLSPISVTQLGWMGTQLQANHQVGIWTAGGTLLVTGTVLPTDPLTGLFRFHSVASTVLGPGTYVIGGENDAQEGYGGFAQTFSTAPQVQFIHGLGTFGTGLQFPTLQTGADPAAFGPNFQFTDTLAVPVPAGLVLSGIGILCVVGFQRFRRKPVLA